MGEKSVMLGGLELTSLDAGEFLYDGGAMFGAVPKVIWETLVPVDDQNRVTLTLSPLLISSDTRKILVDVGFGICLLGGLDEIDGLLPGEVTEERDQVERAGGRHGEPPVPTVPRSLLGCTRASDGPPGPEEQRVVQPVGVPLCHGLIGLRW